MFDKEIYETILAAQRLNEQALKELEELRNDTGVANEENIIDTVDEQRDLLMELESLYLAQFPEVAARICEESEE